MSIKKMVSVGLAVQTAMEDMGLRDNRMRPLLTRWAVDAENKIGSFYSYKRDYVKVEMCDAHRGEIPCHIVAVNGIIMGCVDTDDERKKIFGMQYDYAAGYANYNAGYFLNYPLNGIYCEGNRLWEIQDNHIVFLYPQTITTITLDCLVYQTDDNGLPLVNKDHLDAISAYIDWKRKKRSEWLQFEQRFNESQLMRAQREWNRLCSDARANDSAPTASERHEIVSMMNNPLSGCAKSVIRYYDEFYWGWR